MSASQASAVVRAIDSVAANEVERSRGASIQVLLGPDDGVPRFVTRCFTLAPGGRIPCHRHATIEHEQVVLEGEMTLGLDDDVVRLRGGDCIFIPAGVAHWYENHGDTKVRFLCMVPLTDGYETEWLEDAAR
jgi:quercetin dioxygenase-like cupin family protein